MIKSRNGMNTIIEGTIIFDDNNDAEIHLVNNIFTVPEEDLEDTITAIENRRTDYIVVEEYEGCIVSRLEN